MTPPLNIILYKCGGPRYRTRSGRTAVVTESNIVVGTFQRIWQGRLDDGQFVEWDRHGAHLGGDASLDLVGVAEEA